MTDKQTRNLSNLTRRTMLCGGAGVLATLATPFWTRLFKPFPRLIATGKRTLGLAPRSRSPVTVTLFFKRVSGLVYTIAVTDPRGRVVHRHTVDLGMTLADHRREVAVSQLIPLKPGDQITVETEEQDLSKI
ncbi:MAG: hypothetical protein KAJ19_20670 [Gammaproteobacteria bacterium]|nr:hypothetical protein [Gammaproteobacteria bacterium]